MRTFLEKIEIERHALKLVNSSMGRTELNGLNEHAIARWRTSTPDARGRVAEMLLLLSQLTRLLTERAEATAYGKWTSPRWKSSCS